MSLSEWVMFVLVIAGSLVAAAQTMQCESLRAERDRLANERDGIRAETVEECALIADRASAIHVVDAWKHPDRCESTGGGERLGDAIRALAQDEPPPAKED